jgi:hypothetical protein
MWTFLFYESRPRVFTPPVLPHQENRSPKEARSLRIPSASLIVRR